MSKYKSRKTPIYRYLAEFNGKDVLGFDSETMAVVRTLMMGGYLDYDESVDGMRVIATPLGMEVLNRE